MRHVDIQSGMSAGCTVYSRFPEIHELMAELLVSRRFRLYRSTDLVGAEIVSIHTRVIAFVWGIAMGMKQGASVGATLFARGLAETGRLTRALGGQERTVFGMSGAGHLFADTQDPVSLDARIGMESVKQGRFLLDEMNETFGPSAKSLREATSTLIQFCEEARIDAAILETAEALMSAKMSTLEAAHYLMHIPVLDE